ncbi:MAG: shikimate kinase [Firmicutes bacterium]|nr:shikimate kinase [Bacillota bacterium]
MLNLVLVGFMGTGKTTVGRKLAKMFGLKFVDTDHEIEQVTGLTVSEIFKKYGEVRFRSEEKAAVRRVTRNHSQVIATGGGVVLNPENMERLKETGIVVCLTAAPEVIYQRVIRKKNRPLLRTEDPLHTIKSLLAERKSFYEGAHVTVDTSNREIDGVIAEVGRIYREYSAKTKE